jgi:hypothetical protein
VVDGTLVATFIEAFHSKQETKKKKKNAKNSIYTAHLVKPFTAFSTQTEGPINQTKKKRKKADKQSNRREQPTLTDRIKIQKLKLAPLAVWAVWRIC